jgi:hypothetical protein
MSKATMPERVDMLLQTLRHEECDEECEHPCKTMQCAHDDAHECLEWQRAEIERLCLEFTHSARTCEMLQADNERLRVERDEWQARAIALFWRGDADDVTAGKIRQATEAIRVALGTQADQPTAAPDINAPFDAPIRAQRIRDDAANTDGLLRQREYMESSEFRDIVRRAFVAGCAAVHENYTPDRHPDFSEAADDYAASLADQPTTATPWAGSANE